MKLSRFFAVLAGLVVATTAWSSSVPVTERIEAVFLLGLGRAPDVDERSAWADRAERPLVELLERQRERIRTDGAERRAVSARAWRDVHGRAPEEAELAGLPERIYAEHVRALAGGLAARSPVYREVVERAYRAALARAPFAEEQDYWNAFPPLPYLVLVGCVENWARRNAPGLMATTGAPTIGGGSPRLAVFRVSPALAAEARRALELPGGDLMNARGRNVILPGAGEIATVGGVHLLVVGRETAR
jgi:hypothetical protein